MYDNIKCKPGCSGCCAQLREISIAEAVIAHQKLVADKLWEVVRPRALAQFKIAQETSPLSWFKMNIKCPMLDADTQLCMVYPVRPAVCSTHFVSSDPEGCSPWSVKKVGYHPVPMVDLLIDFQKRLSSSVAAFGIMSFMAPIPVALLIAEKIQMRTNLNLPELIRIIMHEF